MEQSISHRQAPPAFVTHILVPNLLLLQIKYIILESVNIARDLFPHLCEVLGEIPLFCYETSVRIYH